MRAHRQSCEWFGVWSAVGFGLVLAFVGIFSLGPFLLPVVTLLLGVAASRRPAPLLIAVGLAAAVGGIACGLEVSVWAYLVTPLVTLVVGLWPSLPRSLAGMLRVSTIGAVVAGCAVAAVSASPAPDTVLAVVPLALVAFALAAVGRPDAAVAGAISGAGLAAVLLGGPPECLLLIAAGLVAFPLMRASAGPRPLAR